MIKKLFFILMLLACIGYGNYSYASHVAGGELTYRWVSDSTYHFTLILYEDCAGVNAANSSPTMPLCIQNGCSASIYSVTLTMPLTLPNGAPNKSMINTYCPGFLTVCNGGTLSGYEECAYEGDFTLPYRCNNWVFGVYISSRNVNNNLSIFGNNNNFYVQATLNNLVAQGNSSAQYTVLPQPFISINQPYTYSNGTVDVNNDSLGYQLIQPMSANDCYGPVANMPFSNATPAFNLQTNPLAANNTFVLDTVTGQMSFTPNLAGRYTLAMLVTEYRNQVAIGTTMRDMQVSVLSGGIPAPTAQIDTTTVALVNHKIQGCAGVPLYFCFKAKSANPGAVLVAADNHSLSAPGSTMSYTGLYTDSIAGCFAWTPALTDAGMHVLTFTTTDSTCNTSAIVLTSSFSIPVFIRSSTISSPDTTICTGGSAQLYATGGTTYTWSVVPGGAPLTSLSCTNCANPIASPASSTKYIVITNQTGGCYNTDTTLVTVVPIPAQPAPTSNGPVCQTDSLQLFAGATAPAYNWTGPAGFTSAQQNPVVANIQPANSGMYYVTTQNGICYSAKDSVPAQVINTPTPVINGTGSLLQTGAYATYQWYLNGVAIAGATGDSLQTTQSGIYTVSVTNANGCTGTSAPFTVPALGVGSVAADGVKVYPNPATTMVYVDAPMAVGIAVCDMTGVQLLAKKNVTQVNIGTLAAGVYFIKVMDGNGVLLKMEKVVKVGK